MSINFLYNPSVVRERERERERVKRPPAFYSNPKRIFSLTVIIAGLLLLVFIFPLSVFAATVSGEAKTSITVAAVARSWKISTVAGRAAQNATSDQVFESAAGSVVTLNFTVDVPTGAPGTANQFKVEILEENTGDVAATPFSTAAEPANNTTITFTPSEAGTFRIKITAQKTDGLGGIGNYGPVDSDTDNNRGYLRAGTTLSESNNARSPAAYADSVTSTMTLGHTPNSSQSVTISFRHTVEISTSTPSSTTTAFTHQDTIDNTFANSSTAVKTRISFTNSAFSGVPWTHITTLPLGFASVTQTGTGNYTALEKTTAFTADPRLTFSTVTADQSAYNRGEDASVTFKLLNSQSEELTQSIIWEVRDSSDTIKTTETDTGPTYGDGVGNSYTIGSTDDAANTTSGTQWDINTDISNAYDVSANTYGVSSLLRISTLSSGTIDSNTQSFADSGYTTSATVFNRNETTYDQFYLYGVRGQLITNSSAIGTTLSLQPRNTLNSSEGSAVSVSADSSGRVRWNYTVGTTHTATADTSGSAKNFALTKTGNTLYQGSGGTEGSGAEWNVSSLYFIDAHPEIDATLNKDDFPTEDANETSTAVIAADIFSFFAHVKNVRKDTNIDTSVDAVEFTVKKPDTTISATQKSETGSDGWTSNYDFAPVAPAGDWSVVASVTFNGNFGEDTEALTFVSPYSGNYQLEAVGWNQTYDIGSTARFTIRTLKRNSSGTFAATAAEATPTYTLRYWDGAIWQHLASGSMTALSTTATYETTYPIPNESAWSGRKVAVSFSGVMSGTRINSSREIEIVSSPAQVIINSITDTTIPTITASVRITNEGNADNFDYTYEYCVVLVDTNQCGGGDDVAYSSAAKRILAGQNFDTTLTLNVTQTGNYIFKVAVWWSNQSSKSSKTFTATSESTTTTTPTPTPSGGGGGGGGASQPTYAPTDSSGLAAVWQKIAEIFNRLLGIEKRVGNLESRVASLERQLGNRVSGPVVRKEISVPSPSRKLPKVETPVKPFFKIRLQ